MNQNLGKILMLTGVFCLMAGLIVYFFGNKLSGPGRLPGDIRIERPGMKIYFPVVTMLLLSLIVNLILWLIRKFF